MNSEELIDLLQDRINFHNESIERFKTYGEMFHDDIKICEGQIMEAAEIMRLVFNSLN